MKLFIVILVSFTLFLSSCQQSTDLGVNTTEENSEFSLAKKPTATASANGEYLVISSSNKLPKKFSKSVTDLNGEVKMIIPEIGVAVISIDEPEVVSGMNGISAVVPDIKVQWLNPDQKVEPLANPPSIGDDEWYYFYQWSLDAIDAPEAWNAEYKGAGARVFILGSGIDAEHSYILPNLKTSLCVSFIEGEDWNVQPGFYFNHGTHVAGIVAAADNAYGSIGVAPEAELVAVKVLSEYDPYEGPFSAILAGIVYAANNGADVINMSLGAYFPKSVYGSNGAHWLAAFNLACNYAFQKGAVIIASAGNDYADRNHDADWLNLPADAAHVISVSATAPIGWAWDKDIFLDNPASYSNYGQSGVTLSAPGGDWMYPENLWWHDMVFSSISGGWGWAAGTSMASPHAAGVAALIIGKNGGSMKPAHVEAVLRASADDLGKPGKDAFYGHGRVNAYKAVMN